ncbi:hypothetical protein KIN20_036690 [Parelaphostrongylus tenuis]|uniref:Uncharacterized protein n=1 Tax=Parelaphostrongylus tenuis TaxID=148309 RepID=A0AAD5WKS2_PARTN|nr:hypothetical protein KIN20_036690 [Parelaphostrongylus tenuis]
MSCITFASENKGKTQCSWCMQATILAININHLSNQQLKSDIYIEKMTSNGGIYVIPILLKKFYHFHCDVRPYKFVGRCYATITAKSEVMKCKNAVYNDSRSLSDKSNTESNSTPATQQGD